MASALEGDNPEEDVLQHFSNLKRVHEERASKLLREYDEETEKLKREKDNEMEGVRRKYEEYEESLNQWRKDSVSYNVARNREERERMQAALNPEEFEEELEASNELENTWLSSGLHKNHPTCHVLQATCALHKEVCIKTKVTNM